MSTQSNFVSLSRHHYPPSPFGRARNTNYDFDLDTTPSQHGTRPYSYRTNTLAGAYQAASHASMVEGMGFQIPTSPSPRRARDIPEALSPSPQRSILPEEFAHNYGRFAEDGTIEGYGHLDDWDGTRSVSRLSQSSWQARERDLDVGSQNGFARSEASFLDYTGEYSPRRKNVDYTKDEQRLRRVTGRDSAVFSKAKIGRAALTADNLQRREVEAQKEESDQGQDYGQQQAEEDDGEYGPSLNVPANWTSRTRTREDWTRKPEQREAQPVSNTPVTIYKNSTFIKPTPTKRDSQDLLRRLARAESPTIDPFKTPEPAKVERQIYDKTPKVTVGGWVDTPIPERVIERVTEPESTKVPTPPSTPPKERMRTRPPLPRPKLPKSGLATLIEEVSSGKETLEGIEFGDGTLESLKELMNDPSLLRTDEEVVAFEEKVLAEIQQFAPSKENKEVGVDKKTTEEAMDHSTVLKTDQVLAEIQQIAPSKEKKDVGVDKKTTEDDKNTIDELRNGMKTLEKKLIPLEKKVMGLSSLKKSPEIAHSHAPSGKCEKCFSSDGRLYAAIPMPRLWKRIPQTGHRQLTKLGWFTIISLIWYIIECLMVEQYSHPFVANTCTGYCLRPDAPRFPFVTVTMLWRWSHLSSILAPVLTIVVAFLRLMAQVLGLWDGYVDEPPRLGKLVGEIRINGTPVAFPWLSSPSAQSIKIMEAPSFQNMEPSIVSTDPLDSTDSMDADEEL